MVTTRCCTGLGELGASGSEVWEQTLEHYNFDFCKKENIPKKIVYFYVLGKDVCVWGGWVLGYTSGTQRLLPALYSGSGATFSIT